MSASVMRCCQPSVVSVDCCCWRLLLTCAVCGGRLTLKHVWSENPNARVPAPGTRGSQLALLHHHTDRSQTTCLPLSVKLNFSFIMESFFWELARREGGPGSFCPSSANCGQNFQRHCPNVTQFPLAFSPLSGGVPPSGTSISLQEHSSEHHLWGSGARLSVSCSGPSICIQPEGSAPGSTWLQAGFPSQRPYKSPSCKLAPHLLLCWLQFALPVS